MQVSSNEGFSQKSINEEKMNYERLLTKPGKLNKKKRANKYLEYSQCFGFMTIWIVVILIKIINTNGKDSFIYIFIYWAAILYSLFPRVGGGDLTIMKQMWSLFSKSLFNSMGKTYWVLFSQILGEMTVKHSSRNVNYTLGCSHMRFRRKTDGSWDLWIKIVITPRDSIRSKTLRNIRYLKVMWRKRNQWRR